MEKNIIEVPRGIRFLSDWKDFNFNNFPTRCIIDKQLPGCGFTEFCLTGPDDLILCSPRIMLIKNKEDQHEGEVYVVHNEMDSDVRVDKNLEKVEKSYGSFFDFETEEEKKRKEEERKKKNQEIYERIYKGISEYIDFRRSQGLPYKIIVTYDSYHLVYDILCKLDIIYSFKTVVDEFQSILHDARFKATTEMNFINILSQSPTTYFVSATPMLDDYIEMLEEFSDLPYFRLDWGTLQPERLVKPNLKVLYMDSTLTKATEIIKEYQSENYVTANVVQEDGSVKEVVSDEAVFFMNSVDAIISVIKKNNLSPDEVNILCANTEENKKKLKKRLGAKYKIGSVPLKGEKHKKYTFCTRTTYLGADFYSLCARSFVFSDSNIDCMAVDIAEDLPQILGRQRLEENPWKNCATLYYKTSMKDVTQEEFAKKLKDKTNKTNEYLEMYNEARDNKKDGMVDLFEAGIRANHYKSDYVSIGTTVDKYTGRVIEIPVFNNLIYVNEIRSYKIAQIDYKDRFSVFASLKNTFDGAEINSEAERLLESYYNSTTIVDRLKVLCTPGINKDVIDSVVDRLSDSDELKSLYKVVGPEKIKATGYNITDLRVEFRKLTFSDVNMYVDIYKESIFQLGSTIEGSEIKLKFKDIYIKNNYLGSPKAVDIFNYFIVEELFISIPDPRLEGKKKRAKAYKILDYKKDSKAYIAYQNYLMNQEALQNLIEQENKNNI